MGVALGVCALRSYGVVGAHLGVQRGGGAPCVGGPLVL